ncbi:purine and uridine phosphorylase [Aspergillus sclerotiicarbonarius CBS 121057]|uniref:Purine and uridine phosphorylase n=1 Tax=Aspergillus sclerotiicarbonarius (strain CBS 121057 / IBT 28362) TaxID=1448318 RepID=A0A319ESD2_ASPSB|nr:purine and uridine phosphorylase [Aspergillus sclerotiicarbonarius CBS 121057]
MQNGRQRSLLGMLQQGLLGAIQLPLTYLQRTVEESNIKEIAPEAITVAIFCALSYEAVAVKYCLDEEFTCRPITRGPKNYVYSFGRLGNYRLVIVRPLQMGVVKAAQCAATVRQQFPNVQFALMVGIGAGIPSPTRRDIRLGDIAVGIPRENHPGVLQYDLGIYEEDEFVLQGCLNKPPSILISADGSLEEDEIMDRSPLEKILKDITKRPGFARPTAVDILYDDNFSHINSSSDCTGCEKSDSKKHVPRPLRSSDQPIVHRGLILSGNGVIKNPQDRDRLRRGYDDAICFEMEAAGIVDEIPCLAVRGICDYADTHKQDGWHHFAAAAAAAYCKAILLKIGAQDVGKANVSILSERTKETKPIWAFIQSTWYGGVNFFVGQRIDLAKLPIAENAMFDSYTKQHESLCLPGTQTEILSCIEDWVDDACGKSIFYLNGMAGTGKSTISRTVAKCFQDKRFLGATFFFRRGASDRGHARKFFSTIARQLLVNLPQLSPSIRRALDESPDIATKSLKVQFERLIIQPLLSLQESEKHVLTLAIVIDALDECESDNDVRLILHLLSQIPDLSVVRLRIFLTSRPELPVRLGFKNIAANKYHCLALQVMSRPTIEHDISLFMSSRITAIRNDRALPHDWPGDTDIQSFVTLSTPSFTFAATVCSILDDPQWDPQNSLTEILQHRSLYPNLDEIYLPILHQILHDHTPPQQDRLIQEFQATIGPIILLETPLSITSLSNLLNHPERLITLRLNPLHSLIHIPTNNSTPIEPLHPSLQHFLLSPDTRKKTPLWIDENSTHSKLTTQCLNLMRRTFEQNNNPPGVTSAPPVAKSNISPEMHYACNYWVQHLLRSAEPVVILDEGIRFLKEYFVRWVEALTICGADDDVLGMVGLLRAVDPDKMGWINELIEEGKLDSWEG